MKIRKDSIGLIGQTTNSISVIIWTNCQHWCSEILTELESLRNKEKKKKTSIKKTEREESSRKQKTEKNFVQHY